MKESSEKGSCDARLMRAIFGILIKFCFDAYQNRITNCAGVRGRNTASDVLVLDSMLVYLILDVLFQEMLRMQGR